MFSNLKNDRIPMSEVNFALNEIFNKYFEYNITLSIVKLLIFFYEVRQSPNKNVLYLLWDVNRGG